jgi:hypothetical protein
VSQVTEASQAVTDYEALQVRVEELADRAWDLPGVEARLSQLTHEGIAPRSLDRDEIIMREPEILDRVQRRAEEYEYASHSCAKGSALAVMEEFGLGDMEIIKSLSPMPGLGMTGSICGAVTGSLLALGLYFGSDDPLNYEGNDRAIVAARRFVPLFEGAVGTILCPKIQEDVIFGRYMDTRAREENLEAFRREKGYEKCALLPGIGARIAARIIIESMK